MNNGQQAAFPFYATDNEGRTVTNAGMNKREVIAMHAMQGLLSSGYNPSGLRQIDETQIAVKAIAIADEILKQLEK